jgi:tripartite-type tricarboxylate transporter receptor subunit TctC
MAGAKVVHVPYRNANESMNGLVSGQVQFSFSVSTAARGQIEAGTVRGLAVTTEEPSPLLPGLPALQTFGLNGFIVKGWGSFVAPAGTPKPIIDKLAAAIADFVKKPEVLKLWKQQGAVPMAMTPEEFDKFLRGDIAKWAEVVKKIKKS